MDLKCRYIFIVIILSFSNYLFAQKNTLSVFFKDINKIEEDKISFAIYFLNCLESQFVDDSYHITLVRKSVDVEHFNTIKNYSSSKSHDGFYYVYFALEDLVFELYDVRGNLLSKSSFSFDFIQNPSLFDDNDFVEQKKEEIFSFVKDSINLIPKDTMPLLITGKQTPNKTYFHNFPYFNLALSGVSFSLYYDNLSNFSFFPISFILSFYPFRYFEVGLFYQIAFEGAYLKYFDVIDHKYQYYLPLLEQNFGLFCGLSFFYEKTHYSLGINIYNNFVSLHDNKKWERSDQLSDYFLPQFSFYQKIDIQLYKNIYYTMWINLRTNQKFVLNGNHFYANFFDYDFVLLDISLLGVSVTF